MRTTLFHIPTEVAGLPLFGFGLLLAVWAVVSLGILLVLVRRQGFNADTRSHLPLLGLAGLVIAFLLPAIVKPEGLPIRGYGAMFLLGVVSGVGLAVYRARRRGLDTELIYSLALWMIVAGLVGARLFYIIEYWDRFQTGPLLSRLGAMVNVTEGGLVVYGSFLAVLPAMFYFARSHKLPILALADLVAPSMLVGLALGRVGCFLNGCCFGGTCDLPWAVEFPFGSPPHQQQVQDGRLFLHGLKLAADPAGHPIVREVEPGSPATAAGLAERQQVREIDGRQTDTLDEAMFALMDVQGEGRAVSIVTAESPQAKTFVLPAAPERSLPIHPAQLYSTLDAVIICFFLLAYDPFRRRDGELLALLITIYPVTRFLIEIIRTDEGPVFQTGLSISQNVSLLLLVVAAGLWYYVRRQPRGVAGGAV